MSLRRSTIRPPSSVTVWSEQGRTVVIRAKKEVALPRQKARSTAGQKQGESPVPSTIRDAAVHFEAVKTSMSQSKQGTILRLAIHPNEVPPSLHTDWVGSRYMVALVKLDDQDQPEIPEERRVTERMIASAGMLCRNPDFAKFLFEQDMLVGVPKDDADRENLVADVIRDHLGIQSRTEFHTNSIAREGFKKLQEEFVRWK